MALQTAIVQDLNFAVAKCDLWEDVQLIFDAQFHSCSVFKAVEDIINLVSKEIHWMSIKIKLDLL